MKAARPKTRFVCQECGYQGLRWSGRCPECAQWNSLREEVQREASALQQRTVAGGIPEAVPIGAITQPQEFRLQSANDHYPQHHPRDLADLWLGFHADHSRARRRIDLG